MSDISSIFAQGRHKALIPYVTVGYPSIAATLKAVSLLAENGCDLVELGIPFSDPLADGATIQKASYFALKNGITPGLCLEIAGELSQKVSIPLVFMTYFNPILSFGLDKFCRECVKAGVDGLIVPDLPPEEGGGLEVQARSHSLDLIYLLAPTSTEERVRLVAERSRGFIYLVSVSGVTGARDRLPPALEGFVGRVRELTDKPLCVGFGISTPEQAGQVARMADGVIVGSRIIQLMEGDDLTALGHFIKGLREAIDKESRS